MKNLEKHLAAALLGLSFCQLANAETQPVAASITETKRVFRPAPEDFHGKKIFIDMPESERLKKMLLGDLKGKGYTIVESREEADIKMKCYAKFGVSGAGKDPVTGNVEELLQAEPMQPPDSPEYTHQSVNLAQIAAPIVAIGVIPIADIFVWITQKVGIAGTFNKAITGDPRGFCLHADCNKFTQRAVTACAGDVAWILQYQAINEKMVIDQVIERALQGMRDQFPGSPATVENTEVSEKQK